MSYSKKVKQLVSENKFKEPKLPSSPELTKTSEGEEDPLLTTPGEENGSNCGRGFREQSHPQAAVLETLGN